ncbi:hypothetical protein EJ419_01120 [Alloscardovia theropitheci]|uniref:Uncharacterized protein n=1 Tax=Alloscardovia theropitheci TaxID=2496842 RepID=A0A4R0QWG4_9BIFI|nr:hypothetical protein [Alloscardovia theropitheci]TCD54737.1 hypothetical protein EJ419_01120 [Alloscardovia theropitheci]
MKFISGDDLVLTQDDIQAEYHNRKAIIEEKRDALLAERFRTYNDLTVAVEAFTAFNDKYGDNDCADNVRSVSRLITEAQHELYKRIHISLHELDDEEDEITRDYRNSLREIEEIKYSRHATTSWE